MKYAFLIFTCGLVLTSTFSDVKAQGFEYDLKYLWYSDGSD